MITYHEGNIIESGCDVLVNPCNIVGVAGAGISMLYAKAFGGSYLIGYQQACRKGLIEVGRVYVHEAVIGRPFPLVAHLATKHHWKHNSLLRYVDLGLADLVKKLQSDFLRPHVRSVAVPALGCGHGGLPWEEVKPLMEAHLSKLDIPVFIYLPH